MIKTMLVRGETLDLTAVLEQQARPSALSPCVHRMSPRWCRALRLAASSAIAPESQATIGGEQMIAINTPRRSARPRSSSV
jgi:hypothetical protein